MLKLLPLCIDKVGFIEKINIILLPTEPPCQNQAYLPLGRFLGLPKDVRRLRCQWRSNPTFSGFFSIADLIFFLI